MYWCTFTFFQGHVGGASRARGPASPAAIMEKVLQPADEKAVRAAIVADAEDHEARGKGLIRLSSLPAHVAAKLSQYDKDGDGTLDWSEVFSGALGACAAVAAQGTGVLL